MWSMETVVQVGDPITLSVNLMSVNGSIFTAHTPVVFNKFFSFGRLRKGSNPQFQPAARLSHKIVSVDQTETVNGDQTIHTHLFLFQERLNPS